MQVPTLLRVSALTFWKPHVGCCQLFYSFLWTLSACPTLQACTPSDNTLQRRKKSSEALCANNTLQTFTCENTGPYLVLWRFRTSGLNLLVWACRSVTGRSLLVDEGCNEAVSSTNKHWSYSIPKLPTPKAWWIMVITSITMWSLAATHWTRYEKTAT